MKLAFIFLVVFVATSYQQRIQQNRMFWMPNIDDADDEYQFDRSYHPRMFGGSPNPFMNPLARQETVDDGYDNIELINPSVVSPNNIYDDQYEGPYASYQRPPMHRSSPNYMNPYWLIENNLNRKNAAANRFQPNNNLFFRNYQDDSYQQRPQEEDPYYNDQTANPAQYFVEKQKIQSRNNYYRPGPAGAVPAQQRFFFNNLFPQEIYFPKNTTMKNGIFGKTYGVISTSTVNITSVVTCVDATEFVVAGPPACRRRRRGMEHLLAFDDLVGSPSGLSPTAVEKVETTLAPELSSYEKRNARVKELLASSKDELVLEDENGDRDKRSFFFYAHTTTITTYTFNTATVTKTVKLLNSPTTSALNCLPAGFVICNPNQG